MRPVRRVAELGSLIWLRTAHMGKIKIALLAATAAIVADLVLWLILYHHAGGETPPDFLGWIALLLCFPAALTLLTGFGGTMLATTMDLHENFVICWDIMRR